MSEILNALEQVVPSLQTVALVVAVATGLIAAAAAAYVAKTAFGPLVAILRGLWGAVQWMFAFSPGRLPASVVAGISFGSRMLVWAGITGGLVWLFFH